MTLLVYALLRARTFGGGPGAQARRLVPVSWLAEQIGCSPRSIERATATLEKLGYIGKWARIVEGRRTVNLYYAYDVRKHIDAPIWERDKADERHREEVLAELAELLRPDAEAELRAQLRAEVERELADELREQIREELLEELSSSHSDTDVGAVDNNSTDPQPQQPPAPLAPTPVSGHEQKSRIRNYPLPLPAQPVEDTPDPDSPNPTDVDPRNPERVQSPTDPHSSESAEGDGFSAFSLFTAPETGQSWASFAENLAERHCQPPKRPASEASSDPDLPGIGGAPAFARPNSPRTPENTTSWLMWYIWQRLSPPQPDSERDRRAEQEHSRILEELENLRKPRGMREPFLDYTARIRQADALKERLETLCCPLGSVPAGGHTDPGRGASELLRRCAEPDDDLVAEAAEFLRRHRYQPARRRAVTGGTVDDDLARQRWAEQMEMGPVDGTLYTGTIRLRTIRVCLQAVYRTCAHLPEAVA